MELNSPLIYNCSTDTALSKVLNNDKILSLDLDSFLATMTVPPPTPNAAVTSELTSTQISSFIIPPPPANQVNIGANFLILFGVFCAFQKRPSDNLNCTSVDRFANFERKLTGYCICYVMEPLQF